MIRTVALDAGSADPLLPNITVVVPTYKEVENLPHLIDRISQLRVAHRLNIDLLIMDDDSRDGSVELVANRPETWVHMIVRTTRRGLSLAVLDGLRQSQSQFLVCMDADLSHPPEVVPEMLARIKAGADFVIASRYVSGGTTSTEWGFLRWVISRVATLLAWPLATVCDPMSGFFALRRSTFEKGHDFDPIGYKIGLELLVRCECNQVVEVPIHFEDRRLGTSKLTFQEELRYIHHLGRLYRYKYGTWFRKLQQGVHGLRSKSVEASGPREDHYAKRR